MTQNPKNHFPDTRGYRDDETWLPPYSIVVTIKISQRRSYTMPNAIPLFSRKKDAYGSGVHASRKSDGTVHWSRGNVINLKKKALGFHKHVISAMKTNRFADATSCQRRNLFIFGKDCRVWVGWCSLFGVIQRVDEWPF
jgi:hypothetical protein